jgi:hypothetical protein
MASWGRVPITTEALIPDTASSTSVQKCLKGFLGRIPSFVVDNGDILDANYFCMFKGT